MQKVSTAYQKYTWDASKAMARGDVWLYMIELEKEKGTITEVPMPRKRKQ